MKAFGLHPEASEEFNAALHHYTDISPELGDHFYDEIERLIAEARMWPATFRQIRSPVRRHLSREFPYGILYVDRPNSIWILAVMPLHREPDYWLHRLR